MKFSYKLTTVGRVHSQNITSLENKQENGKKSGDETERPTKLLTCICCHWTPAITYEELYGTTKNIQNTRFINHKYIILVEITFRALLVDFVR